MKLETLELIRQLHADVWETRRKITEFAGRTKNPGWPTPNRTDALRFACCEGAEVVDSVLRMNTDYVRSNDEKWVDYEKECADTIIMLLTFLGPMFRRAIDNYKDVPDTPDESVVGASHADVIYICCGGILRAWTHTRDQEYAERQTMTLLAMLLAEPDNQLGDMCGAVRKVLADKEEKYGKVHLRSPYDDGL